INDSFRYPPREFQKDDPSRKYQVGSYVSYYIIPHRNSLTKITQENHIPELITPNKPKIPHTEDTEGPPDLINTEGIHEQNLQNDQMITQPTNAPSRNNTEVLRPITKPLVPHVTQSHIPNQASTSSHLDPQDRWSRNQHIKLVNIIVNPSEGMLTRRVAAKLIAALASECLFANFLSKIEPKKFEKRMTKKFEMSMMGELSYFLGLQIKQDEKGILICQEQYTRNLLKKYKISDSSSVKTPMVPPNNLGPDLAGKLVNETSYKGMIRSLMYLTATRPDIQFSTVLCARKSITGSCKILGGKLVCWSAMKQQSVAISSAEAEYVAAAGCCASIL
nr:hypothetical protein [Tanacetum cinerariifolium]